MFAVRLRRLGGGGGRRVCHRRFQPPPHLLTTLPVPAGGGRCVRHATAATGRRRRRGTGTARGRPGRAARAGGGGRGAAGRARRRTRPPVSVSDGQARGPHDRPRWRIRSASRQTCRTEALGRTACRARRRSRHGAERRVGGHWSRLRGQSVSPPSLEAGTMTARDLRMLPVAAVEAPWRAADRRRRTR